MRHYSFLLLLGMTWMSLPLASQEVLIHSHNDYQQTVPFYEAYSQKVASIEADVFLVDGKLLVAHDTIEWDTAPTLDEAYLQPLIRLFKQNKGTAWKDSNKQLQLMIELKSETEPLLSKVIDCLKRNPEVFDPAVNPHAVRIIITGNVPKATDYHRYPAYILFDETDRPLTAAQLQHVGMISLNLADYTTWNGKGMMIAPEAQRVQAVIDRVHALGKPIRFWGTPDGITAWNTFHRMGVDYINTDHPEACAAFFRNFGQKQFQIGQVEETDEIARAKRLDKTTAGFQGFRSRDLQLCHPIEVYRPNYIHDGSTNKVKNVILLIGDGMGLAQICAADAVNQGLSILNMKYIGLSDTHAEDAFTTDSAAGGSALATGKKNKNRHISMSGDGQPYLSLTDLFYTAGKACGVVTLGNIADATPAVFYGHSTERDNANEITAYLLDGKLTLLSGSGMDEFTRRSDGIDLIGQLKQKGYTFQSDISNIRYGKGKVICIDERMGKAATEATLSLLAETTAQAISKLSQSSQQGFFLMVEGAKIDYAGHANSLPGSVLETLSFDLAVQQALRFADSNGETLVIVTADHETGGLTLVDGDLAQHSIVAQYMTDDHTPIRVPVFAYGPHAADFAGAYQNTEIFHRIKKAVALDK